MVAGVGNGAVGKVETKRCRKTSDALSQKLGSQPHHCYDIRSCMAIFGSERTIHFSSFGGDHHDPLGGGKASLKNPGFASYPIMSATRKEPPPRPASGGEGTLGSLQLGKISWALYAKVELGFITCSFLADFQFQKKGFVTKVSKLHANQHEDFKPLNFAAPPQGPNLPDLKWPKPPSPQGHCEPLSKPVDPHETTVCSRHGSTCVNSKAASGALGRRSFNVF